MSILWKGAISKNVYFEDVWGLKYMAFFEAVVQWTLQIFVSKKPLSFCMSLKSVNPLGMLLYVCALL